MQISTLLPISAIIVSNCAANDQLATSLSITGV